MRYLGLVMVIALIVGITLAGAYAIMPKIPECTLLDSDTHGIHLEYAPPQE